MAMIHTAATTLLNAFALVGLVVTVTGVVRWARARWRTRRDKGYDASRWGAY